MNPQVKWIVVALVALVVVLLAFNFIHVPDHRDAAERMGDAIRTLPDGADKAGQQLEDRTPAQRAGDAIRGVGK